MKNRLIFLTIKERRRLSQYSSSSDERHGEAMASTKGPGRKPVAQTMLTLEGERSVVSEFGIVGVDGGNCDDEGEAFGSETKEVETETNPDGPSFGNDHVPDISDISNDFSSSNYLNPINDLGFMAPESRLSLDNSADRPVNVGQGEGVKGDERRKAEGSSNAVEMSQGGEKAGETVKERGQKGEISSFRRVAEWAAYCGC
ncbi:hypothetical protein C8J56DRAFT_360515 [Mycena floridula]|nr:hypothetical protein C8J56DRAFT_360515 [Mycena floridula]